MSVQAADGRRRILLADGNALNRALIEGILTAADFQVDEVVDGASLADALIAKHYDLVLVDMRLAGLDTNALASAARSSSRATRPLIVAMSAVNQERQAKPPIEIDDHVSLPIAPRALITRLEKILASSAVTAADGADDVISAKTFSALVQLLGRARIATFLGLLETRLLRMRKMLCHATETNDEILREAHDLASAAGMLGFLNVTRCCEALSVSAQDGALRRSHLADAVNRAIAAIQQMRETASTQGLQV